MRLPLNEEQRQKVRDMDIESLAKVAFCYLKSKYDYSDSDLPSVCSVEQIRTEIYPTAEYRSFPARSDYSRLFEAITLLQRRGLVVIDIRHLMIRHEDYNTVFLTSVGRESSVDDGVLLLVNEPEKTIASLEESVGRLDDIVRQYYLESIRAFQAGLYISSVINLGVASERAIYWLAEAIDLWSPKYKANFKAKEGRISEFTAYLRNDVIREISKFDNRFKKELTDQLEGLANLYSKNRNDTGHPKTVDHIWSREDQQFLLVQFKGYIGTICKARRILQ